MRTFMCWLQALYVTYNPDGKTFKLPYCIITFGFVQFLMSQLPDLHSLRFLNALSNFCTVTFSTIAVGMSIHNGKPLLCSQHKWHLPPYHGPHTTVTCSLVLLDALFIFVSCICYIVAGPLAVVLVQHSGRN